jgi:hypothetical protein
MSGELVITGGNPKVVATRDEIARCSYWIGQAMNYISKARSELIWEETLFGFDMPNLWGSVQRGLTLENLTGELEHLQRMLYLASEAYFSTEIQMNGNYWSNSTPIGSCNRSYSFRCFTGAQNLVSTSLAIRLSLWTIA